MCGGIKRFLYERLPYITSDDISLEGAPSVSDHSVASVMFLPKIDPDPRDHTCIAQPCTLCLCLFMDGLHVVRRLDRYCPVS